MLTDLKNVPKNATIRKVNELVKRVRLAKAHAYIVGHLKKEMPSMFGNKGKAQAKLLGSLEDHFLKVIDAATSPRHLYLTASLLLPCCVPTTYYPP